MLCNLTLAIFFIKLLGLQGNAPVLNWAKEFRGDWFAKLALPRPPRPPLASLRKVHMQVKLKVLAGKNAGKELKIPVKRFLIGRGDDCHMRPKSEAISRNHCAILINEEEDKVVIRDLNSRNGTYVNGERLAADQPLQTGDHLRIGRLEFEVMIKDRKRVPEPAAAPDRGECRITFH